MNSPNVASFEETDSSRNPIRFTVSTDIVDHMESARTFGREQLADPTAHGRFQRRVIAIPDRRPSVLSPMFLTLSSNEGLYLVRRNEAAGADWAATDLGASFPAAVGGSPKVRAVGAAATADDRVAIAVAVDDTAGSRVFIAYDLSSAKTDWSKIPWVDCGPRPNVQVEAIRVLDNGDRTWTVVFAGSQGANDTVYLLRSGDPGRKFAEALVFSPAATLQELLDFEPGVHPDGGSGLYVLGRAGRRLSLAFRPFPTYDSHGRFSNIPPAVVLRAPEGANVIEVGPTTDDGTDLYVGGQGIHLITGAAQSDGEQAEVTAIAPPEAAANVVDVAIGATAGPASTVWALLENGDLNVISRANGNTWGTPLLLRSSVQELAPVGADEHQSASILVVYGDGTAAHVWRDAGTGVWQEAPIPVADPGDVTPITCYGTSIRLLDGAGLPKPGIKVKASASVLSSVSINGDVTYLGPGVEVEAVTDTNGAVNLYDRVRSLTPAVYRFSFDTVNQTFDVNPAASVHQRFLTISGDDLREGKITALDGSQTPLLPGGVAGGQIDVVAGALNQGAKLSATTDGPIPGVRTVGASPSGVPFSTVLRADALAPDYRWGLQTDGVAVKPVGDDIISTLVKATEDAERFFIGLGDSIADFFEALEHRVEEGLIVVLHKAEEAFEFVCQLAGKVRRWVLNTLEEAGAFFKWLWSEIKLGLENVWQWLKFAFDWQDILQVRDTLVAVTDQGLRYLQRSTSGLKANVTGGFDQALAQIEKWRAEAGVPPTKLTPPPAGLSASALIKSVTSDSRGKLDQMSGNSVVGWVMKQIESVVDEIVTFEGPSPTDDVINAAVDFATGLAGDEIDNLLDTIYRIQADLGRLFDGQVPRPEDLSFETLRDAIIAVGSDALEGMLKGLRDLVLRAIDLVAALIGAIRDALFLRVRFPFVEKLAELVSPGSHVDASFRFIDGLMLLAAVPATIAYKIFFGEKPFNKGEVIELPFGSVTVQAGELDTVKRLSWIGGLAGAFVKTGLAGKQTYAVYQSFLGDTPPPPPPVMWVQGVGDLFAAVGLAAEIGSRHGGRGDAVTGIEWAMVGVSTFSLLKSVTILVMQAVQRQVVPNLLKVQAGLDVCCYTVHFILRTADFAVIIDQDRTGNAPADIDVSQDETLESLGWIESLFDHAGSGLLSAAVLDEDPETKAGLLAGGAGCKGYAFVSNLATVLWAGKISRSLIG